MVHAHLKTLCHHETIHILPICRGEWGELCQILNKLFEKDSLRKKSCPVAQLANSPRENSLGFIVLLIVKVKQIILILQKVILYEIKTNYTQIYFFNACVKILQLQSPHFFYKAHRAT